tara:strand:- start:10143 stop:11564 length:1422 start_codon:yes stop_codon:yes gene_type:complete
MSIQEIDIANYTQDLHVDKEDKEMYGEILSPFSLIEDMFSLLPPAVFQQKNKRWLDTGAGSGFFSMILYHKLYDGLREKIPLHEERHKHIIENMLFMVELREKNVEKLKQMFGETANIIYCDFLSTDYHSSLIKSFDYVIGNPPFHFNGVKKVPTNTTKSKKTDGITPWFSFIKRSIGLLRTNGLLLYIVPAIWMKPDKARAYHYLTSYHLEKIKCYTNTETNKIFSGEAQTPTSAFLLKKKHYPTLLPQSIELFDKDREKFTTYILYPENPIPLFGASIIQKLQPFIGEAKNHLQVVKTNMPKKTAILSVNSSTTHPYPNIHTCKLDYIVPTLKIVYSDQPLAFYGDTKLCLAHKMYGFPFLDTDGKYGISNRDNYVIYNKTVADLKQIAAFLRTKTALYIYEAARYRMKYLEKYAFEFIPDISQLEDFPSEPNDENIAQYFDFDSIDRENIAKLHKKNYQFSFIDTHTNNI